MGIITTNNIMSRLVERTVQKVALDHLEKIYKHKAKKRRIFAKMETRTKKDYGGFRADGLLAYKKRWTGSIYVVSMEAKSFKTLKNILPYRSNALWFKNSLWAGFLFSVGTGSVFALVGFENPILGMMFWGSVFALGFFGYGLLSQHSYKHQTMEVLDQVERYHANEKWISISEDSLLDFTPKQQDDFKQICKNRGYGLILVGRKKRVTVYSKPKKTYRLFGNFLIYYSLEDKIKAYLK